MNLLRRRKAMEELLADADFWEEQRLIWNATFIPLLQAAFLDGAVLGSEEITALQSSKALEDEAWGGFQVEDVNDAAIRYIRGYSDPWWEQFNAGTQKRLRNAIELARTSGLGPKEVARLIEPDFGIARARGIAVTELTRVLGQGAQEEYRALGYEQWQWRTVVDDRVCFPASTLVETSTGPVPIAAIRAGDVVRTRDGLRPVLAVTSRSYSGRMLAVHHERGFFSCTEDHPVWVIGRGWVEAQFIHAGDLLQLLNDEECRVLGCCEFLGDDANHVESACFQECRLAAVAGGVAVPIGAVHLNCDPGQEEVHAVSSYPRLLLELQSQFGQGLAGDALGDVLPAESAIAGQRAELAVGVARHAANLHVAGAAANEHGRAAALFATEPPHPHARALLPAERGAAAFACHCDHADALALEATDHEPSGGRSGHDESLPADAAQLGDVLGARIPAREATEPSRARRGAVNLLSTGGAGNHAPAARPKVIAPLGAEGSRPGDMGDRELVPTTLTEHALRHTPSYQPSRATSIQVYDLAVEGCHEFFANGVLVHNCPLCAPLNGHHFAQSTSFEPKHPGCRCFPSPVKLTDWSVGAG